MRYRVKPKISLASALALAVLLCLACFGCRSARAAEEPLTPEFLEYLGEVESSGIQGLELMSLEDLYLMLKKSLHEMNPSKKDDDHSKGKEREHGDAPNT